MREIYSFSRNTFLRLIIVLTVLGIVSVPTGPDSLHAQQRYKYI